MEAPCVIFDNALHVPERKDRIEVTFQQHGFSRLPDAVQHPVDVVVLVDRDIFEPRFRKHLGIDLGTPSFVPRRRFNDDQFLLDFDRRRKLRHNSLQRFFDVRQFRHPAHVPLPSRFRLIHTHLL